MMNKRLGMQFLFSLLVCLLGMSSAFAQNTSAALTGRVTDTAGNPVAGATVEIVHVPSNTARTDTTNADGRYSAQGLRVGGPFKVTVSKQGLQSSEKTDVYLQLAQEATLNVSLGPSATELNAVSVTASAVAQTFQPDNKGVSINISQRELQVLPNPDRSIQQIARMDPFITLTNNNAAGGFAQISALGQNNRYNNIMIDAVPTNDSFGLEANGLPSQNQPLSYDAIEEYNISTANYDVTNKRAVGAAINIVTKSGTNDFHGSAYYAYTNANDLTGNGRNDTDFRGYTQKWTGGASLGGPIIKDTLFFFLDLEESRLNAPAPSFGPIGSGRDNIVPITQDQLDQIISIAKGYGMQPGDINATAPNQDEKRALAKIDWNIADGHRMSFRYDQTRGSQPIIQGNFTGSSPQLGLSSYWYTQDRKLQQGVLNFYDDWSTNFSTETSVSYAKYRSAPTVPAQQPQVQVYVDKADPATQNAEVEFGEDQFRHYNLITVKTFDAFFAGTYTIGDHAIKGGFDFQSDDFYDLFGRTEFGAYVFNSIADFEAGKYASYNLFYPAPGYTLNDIATDWTLNQLGLFLQDTWQATPNLSLQYGIRYDLPQSDGKPIYNAAFTQAFGLRNNATVGTGVFEPRVSFNYSFDTDLKTQLRGGVGLSEGVTPGVWLNNSFANNGITQTSVFVTNGAPGSFNPNPFTQVPPAGTPPTPEIDLLDPHFQLPTVFKASLGFDRELPWWGMVFTADYQYLKNENAILYQDLNLGNGVAGVLPDGRLSYWANPYYNFTTSKGASGVRTGRNTHFGDVVYLSNSSEGGAQYLSLQVEKALSQELSGRFGVVMGKSTDINSGTSSQAFSNYRSQAVYNPNEDVASPSNYDFRDRIISSLTWQHHFFGDYRSSISAFYDGHTGQPYSWIFGTDVSGVCNGAPGTGCQPGLVYIPRGPGDVEFANGTSDLAKQQFFDFIAHNGYLKGHTGEVAQRNGAHAAWVNQLNLSFSQEIPGIWGRGEVKFDIFNFANMLNKKWGEVYDIDFPYNRTLANFAGVDQATGKYVYSLPTDKNGNYAPGALKFEDQFAQSRWSVLVTLRYTF
jgi:outer membrane receptor for ferrienterochelin and colicin